MYLMNTSTHGLVEVLDLYKLINPAEAAIRGRIQTEESLPNIDYVEKSELAFPSGEPLPQCWLNNGHINRV